MLVFNSLGSITSGKTLSVLNAGADGYAFQLLGDYTDVAAVPEPGSYAMLLAGLGLMGTIVRRRRVRSA